MTAKEAGRSKGPKAGNGRGSTPRGPANPSTRKNRVVRNGVGVDDSGTISPLELVLLSEDPLFIDGLKQIAQVHLGGMPDHLVKLAAKLGADLAMAYDALGAPPRKKSSRSKRR